MIRRGCWCRVRSPVRVAARRRYRGAHHPLDLRHQGRRADLDHRRAVLPLSDRARTPRPRRRRRMTEAALTAQDLERDAGRPPRARRRLAVAVVGSSGRSGRTERRRQDHAAARAGGLAAVRRRPSRSAATPCRRCRYANEQSALPICRRGTSCTGRCRRATSWRSAAIRMAPPIRPACRRATRRRCCGRCRRSMSWNLPSAASPNCPAASAAASRWRACWRWKRRSSWRTSRPPRSIRATRSTS